MVCFEKKIVSGDSLSTILGAINGVYPASSFKEGGNPINQRGGKVYGSEEVGGACEYEYGSAGLRWTTRDCGIGTIKPGLNMTFCAGENTDPKVAPTRVIPEPWACACEACDGTPVDYTTGNCGPASACPQIGESNPNACYAADANDPNSALIDADGNLGTLSCDCANNTVLPV